MQKKCLSLFVAIIFSILAASAADKVHVIANSEFNTAKPPQKIDVIVLEEAFIGSNELKAHNILHCNVIKVISPKRGKRAASFAVSPIAYTSDGITKSISGNYYGKYSKNVLSKDGLKNIDATEASKKAAISVGNHFVKGVAPAIAMAEGMIKNEDGNRLESGVKQVYKSSPLSLVEKGKNLDIKQGDSFYLVFKPSKSETAQGLEEELDADDDEE